MPGDKAQVLDQAPGEKGSIKRVYYEGSDTLKNGYALCYNRDYGTATSVDYGRAARVEKPAATNLLWFAGLVVGLPAAGKTGPCRVNIVDARVPQICIGHTSASVTIDSDGILTAAILCVQAASYKLGGSGSGIRVGMAAQTVDGSSTSADVLMYLEGV